MNARPGAFAGCFGAGADATRRETLERALSPDGPACSDRDGLLTVAWTGALSGRAGSAWCVLDGAPDVAALRDRLDLPDDTSPAAVLAVGYERWAERVLEDLGGPFGGVLWAGGQGLLIRDRQGVCPVFYRRHGPSLLFASEVRNLLALMIGVPPPDEEALSDWLHHGQTRDGRTLFAGLRLLGSGEALRLHASCTATPWRYWRLTPHPIAAVEADLAAQSLRSGVDAAVAAALGDAGRPGVMLSGGLDSAVVAASAARRNPAALTAYSLVFPEAPTADERSRIEAVCGGLGLPAVMGAFTAGSAIREALDFLGCWRLPTSNPNLFLWMPLLRRAAADGIDVLLDGEGGDELFGVEPFLIADRLRGGRWLEGLRLARRLPGLGEHPRPRWVARALAKYGVRGAIPRGPHELLRRLRRTAPPGWWSEELLADQRRRDDQWAWKRLPGPRWWVHRAQLLTAYADHVGAEVQFRREGLMAGLTLRHPLRAPELISLVLGLPPELAYDPNIDRPLARRAMRDRIPDEVLASDEKPFFDPLMATALGGMDRGVVGELLREPHPELARRVRREAMAGLAQRAGYGRAPWTWVPVLWRTLLLELWLEHLTEPERVAAWKERLPEGPGVKFFQSPSRVHPTRR